jgi:DNA polymerase III subunit delta'
MSVFDQLIDQDKVCTVLKEAVAASRDVKNIGQQMTHSWLFTGPAGSGRSNAAIAFASALVCPSGGCNKCNECLSATSGSHADVELIRTEGLSIKIDEIRDLISRASWAPSVANYRVVVIEDADRLTESAANALLKVIEEPGARTVWLLCAPTLTDVLPTIRSRCRHLALHTPSIKAVTKLLIERDQIKPELAEYAARISQGHIGVARHLATNKEMRDERLKSLRIPSMLTDLNSAYKAAALLVDAAKQRAENDSEIRNGAEIEKLKQAWGATGSKLTSGGSKAIKELEKEQKTRGTRLVRDYLDRALLDLATYYRDVMLVQSGATDFLINSDLQDEITNMATTTPESKTLAKIQAILKTRINLGHNAAPLLAVEALMCELRR